jgi:hypothetical protein
VDTCQRHFGPVKLVGYLDQDACPVTHQLVSTDRTAVVQVFQYLQALLHDGMGSLAANVGHKPNTAGVVLFIRCIQPQLRRFVLK